MVPKHDPLGFLANQVVGPGRETHAAGGVGIRIIMRCYRRCCGLSMDVALLTLASGDLGWDGWLGRVVLFSPRAVLTVLCHGNIWAKRCIAATHRVRLVCPCLE